MVSGARLSTHQFAIITVIEIKFSDTLLTTCLRLSPIGTVQIDYADICQLLIAITIPKLRYSMRTPSPYQQLNLSLLDGWFAE